MSVSKVVLTDIDGQISRNFKIKNIMKIEIRVGNTSSNKRVVLPFEKLDNIDNEKKRMYDFLTNCKDCIIENVDNFLLYTLNNGLMAYII